MNILITGGAGFIGSNLTRKLLANGDTVTCVDNLITSNHTNIDDLKTSPRFQFIKTDITTDQFKRYSQEFNKIDVIYHLACPTGVPNIQPLSEQMLMTCSIGTKNVFELAIKHNCKVLLTSSSEVYGDPKVFPQAEEYTGNVDPVGHRSPYEEGKRFAESLVRTYSLKYTVDAKIVRIFNTYGPFAANSDTRVVPQFIQNALSGKPLIVKGTGKYKRTFCFVDDLLDGFLTIVEKGSIGQVYNLGGDKEISIQNLARLIIKLSNSTSQIKFIDSDFHDHKRRKPLLDKVKKLGWSQKTNLEQGLIKTISHYQI